METPLDLAQAGAAVLQAMAEGSLTPGEASIALVNLGRQRDNLVANQLDERLKAIEARQETKDA